MSIPVDTLAAANRHPAGRTVKSVALALFDSVATAKAFPSGARSLLALAAAVFEAIPADQRNEADRIGRDMVLQTPLPDVSQADQAIVASVLAFQRRKVHPQREPSFYRLDKDDQETALALSAMLALAVALGSGLEEPSVEVQDGRTTVTVATENAAGAGVAVQQAVKRWKAHVGPLMLQAVAPDPQYLAHHRPSAEDEQRLEHTSTFELPAPLITHPGDALVAEAARQQLRHFFDKLLAREDAVRSGEDAEDVHQMRVATRRLRASLQVVEGVYDPELVRRYRRGLGRVARALGAVRDGDVFLAHMLAYRDGLPEDQRAGMEALMTAVSAERARARRELLDTLDSRRYEKLKRAFAAFLTTPETGVLPPPEPHIRQRVRDFAGSAILRRYELWRAYEAGRPGVDDEVLHAARIAGKHLRYTLEFFSVALGPAVTQVLEPLVTLQDSLGALQDSVTARLHIAALGMSDDSGARQYLAARSAEHDVNRVDIARRWERVASATYRRQLFALLMKL